MTRFLTTVLLAALVAFAVPGGGAQGAVVANGDFSIAGADPPPFADWSTTYGNEPTNGTGSGDQGYALFAEGTSFAMTELEQTFHLPRNAGELSFEFRIESSSQSNSGTSVDSFQATLYDSALNPFPG